MAMGADAGIAAHGDLLPRGHGRMARVLRYWYNEQDGSVFCLVEAPTPSAACVVDDKLDGEITEVKEGT